MKNVFFIFMFVIVGLSAFARLKFQDFDSNAAAFVLAKNTLDSNVDMGELARILESRVLQNPPDYNLDSKGEIILPNEPFKIIPNIEPQVHASAIVGHKSRLMVLFYAGTKEGDADVKIYQSFLDLDSKVSKEKLGDIESRFYKTNDFTNLDSKKVIESTNKDSKLQESLPIKLANLESKNTDSIKLQNLESRFYQNSKFNNLESKQNISPQQNKTQNLDSIKLANLAKDSITQDSINLQNIESNFYQNNESNNLQNTGTKFNIESRFHKNTKSKHSTNWSKPRAILTKSELEKLTGKYFRKLGNPIVFKDKFGKLHCFIVGVSLGGWATSKVYQFEFDASYNLIFKGELHLSAFGNMSYLVRAPALPLENGGFMLPLAHEMWIKYPLIAYFDDKARLRFTQKINDLKFHLQPSIMPLTNSECVGIFRAYRYVEKPPLMTQFCRDFGNIWESPRPSNLTNDDASSILIAFENDGRQEILLAHNDTTRKNLSLYYLDTKNLDSKIVFKKLFLIDLQDGEVSYPAMFVDDKNLHITYTFYRKNIAYKRVPLNVIAEMIKRDRDKI